MIGIGLGVAMVRPRNERVYVLRDQFLTDRAAPLGPVRTCEPGPGTLTVTDPNNRISVTGGRLFFNAGDNVNIGAQSAVSIPHAPGRALMCDLQNTGTRIDLIWGGLNTNTWDWEVGNVGANLRAGTALLGAGQDHGGANKRYWIIRSELGRMLYIYDGQLAWVSAKAERTLADLPVTVRAFHVAANGYADNLAVVDLPGKFATEYGLATRGVEGAVAAGQAFAHTPDCLLEWLQTALPSSGSTFVRFRVQDANNYWRAEVTPAGDLNLAEVIAGAVNPRATAAGVVAAGHRIALRVIGTTIHGVSNNVSRWSYASATNFQAATAGELTSLGTGGAVTDLLAWERDVSAYLPAGV